MSARSRPRLAVAPALDWWRGLLVLALAPADVNASAGANFQASGVTQGGWGDASGRAWFARAL
jgi:hypothetical protein